MDKHQEQMRIRAEIAALTLIEKHLKSISNSQPNQLEINFIFAKLDAEKEAEENINYNRQFSIDYNAPYYSDETLQWFFENTLLNYDTYLKKLQKISSLKEKIELTENEKFIIDFYSDIAENHLKNKLD